MRDVRVKIEEFQWWLARGPKMFAIVHVDVRRLTLYSIHMGRDAYGSHLARVRYRVVWHTKPWFYRGVGDIFDFERGFMGRRVL